MNMEFAKKLLPELYGTEFSVRKMPAWNSNYPFAALLQAVETGGFIAGIKLRYHRDFA